MLKAVTLNPTTQLILTVLWGEERGKLGGFLAGRVQEFSFTDMLMLGGGSSTVEVVGLVP